MPPPGRDGQLLGAEFTLAGTHGPICGCFGLLLGSSHLAYESSARPRFPGRCVPAWPLRRPEPRRKSMPFWGCGPYSGTLFRLVTCPSGRRCNTRNVVWCKSQRGFKSHRHRQVAKTPVPSVVREPGLWLNVAKTVPAPREPRRGSPRVDHQGRIRDLSALRFAGGGGPLIPRFAERAAYRSRRSRRPVTATVAG